MDACGCALDEPTIAFVLRETLHALAYLHGERRIHRDIKARGARRGIARVGDEAEAPFLCASLSLSLKAKNILVSGAGGIKLSDFGATAQLTDTTTKRSSMIGTPYVDHTRSRGFFGI